MRSEAMARRPAPVSGACPHSGQAMVEMLLVMVVLCVLFFGLLQVALVFNAHEVLHHSAARAARARAVGLNDWMVTKSQLVAAIPNSGRMLEPVDLTPSPSFLDPDATPGKNWDRAVSSAAAGWSSPRPVIELARIPEYLDSENHLRSEVILDYEEWENGAFDVAIQHTGAAVSSIGGAGTVRAAVRQRFPLLMPLHALIYRGETDGDGVDRVSLKGESEVIDHASLYLR